MDISGDGIIGAVVVLIPFSIERYFKWRKDNRKKETDEAEKKGEEKVILEQMRLQGIENGKNIAKIQTDLTQMQVRRLEQIIADLKNDRDGKANSK